MLGPMQPDRRTPAHPIPMIRFIHLSIRIVIPSRSKIDLDGVGINHPATDLFLTREVEQTNTVPFSPILSSLSRSSDLESIIFNHQDDPVSSLD